MGFKTENPEEGGHRGYRCTLEDRQTEEVLRTDRVADGGGDTAPRDIIDQECAPMEGTRCGFVRVLAGLRH